MANKFGIRERLSFWSILLSRPNGVSYTEFEDYCNELHKEQKESLNDYEDVARKDIECIKELIRCTNIKLNKKTKGRVIRFSLSEKTDLQDLHQKALVAQPYQELMNLLVKAEGILPDDLWSNISSVYKKLYENSDDKQKCVLFESDYEIIDGMKWFHTIYNAINKYGLLVTAHRAHNTKKTYQVLIFPEVLKQYQSVWYVYGMVFDAMDKKLVSSPGRIPLTLIDNIEEKEKLEFRSSETNYEDYFDEIVGLENDKHCPLKKVKILVKQRIYERIVANPLHGTQAKCDDYKRKGFSCIQIKVRKNKEIIRKLLSYGSDVIVMEPESLRKDLIKEISRSLDSYSQT